MDGALVVAGRDGPVLLQFGEEVLDQVAGLVEVLVVRAQRHRQVDAGEDKEAPSLIGATASCGSLDARDLSLDREGLRADGSVLAGGEVIAVEMKEVVDLVVGGEEPLRLAG